MEAIRAFEFDNTEKVFVLSLGCTIDGGNPTDCPLHDLRKISVPERLKAVQGMSEDAKLKVLEYHKKCEACKLRLLG